MDQRIQKILEMNGIRGDVLEQALYQDIRETFLGEICAYMKSGEARYVEIRKIYYRTSDDLLAARKIVRKVCGGTLPDVDLMWLDRCIKAYFHKRPRRRPISEAERTYLWRTQGERCAICGRAAALREIHVDHIVPWDYVGDELPDNLQVLCPDCNERKNNRMARALHNLFAVRKGAS